MDKIEALVTLKVRSLLKYHPNRQEAAVHGVCDLSRFDFELRVFEGGLFLTLNPL